MPHCTQSTKTVVHRKGSLAYVFKEWEGRGFEAYVTGDRSSAKEYGERRARQIARRHWLLQVITSNSSQDVGWQTRTIKRTSAGICVNT